MATMAERNTSRPVNWGSSGGDEVLELIVFGTDNEVTAYNTVMAGTSTVINGLIRSQIRLRPWGDDSTWDVELTYRPLGQDGTTDALGTAPTDPSTNAPADTSEAIDGSYSFDISVETIHVTKSIRTMGRIGEGFTSSGTVNWLSGLNYRPVGPAVVQEADLNQTLWITGGGGFIPGAYVIVAIDVGGNSWTLDRSAGTTGTGNFQIKPQAEDRSGAINYTDESIEGCDVFGTRFEWSRTVSYAAINRNYQLLLRSCVGKKNNAPFYGCAPGECLYLGASGQYTQSRWSITHRFSEIANESNIVIRPGLIVPHKRGWDYLWVRYKQDVVGTTRINVAKEAYIEEVVADANFANIGIGA